MIRCATDDLLTRYDAAKKALDDLTNELKKDSSIKEDIPKDDKLYKPGDTAEYPFPADAPETTGESIVGSRHIRLIPSAYIEAGVDATVNVIESDDTSAAEAEQRAENAVRIRGDSGDSVSVSSKSNPTVDDVSNIYFPYYNFAQTAGYLVTDVIGLGIYKNYKNLDADGVEKSPAPKYQTYDANEIRDDLDFTQRTAERYFAMSSVYNQAASYTDEDGPGLKPDSLVNQILIGNTYNSDIAADTDVAKTIVKIFKADRDSTSNQVVYKKIGMNNDPEATDEYAQNYKKWSGQSKFTSDDVGVYAVRFLWVLKDGRYLTDEKEVVIRSLTSGLQKSVDLEYMTTSDKEITYTLSYVNDRSTDSVNLTLFDVLPFNKDTRLKREDDGLADELNTGNPRTNGEISDDFELESITLIHPGGAQIYGLYYTTDDRVRDYLTEGDDKTPNPAAADKLERKDGRITDTGISWTDVPKNSTNETYNNKIAYNIGAENVKAIALTANGLPVGETLSIEFTLKCNLDETDISDEFVNNSFYSVDGVDATGEETTTTHKADYSNSVLTAVVGRDISGYAWHDKSVDGVLDGFEERLQNVEVAIYTDSDKDGEYTDSDIGHVHTDKNGFYIFKNIPYLENCRIVFLAPKDGEISVYKSDGTPTGQEVKLDELKISETLLQTQHEGENEIGTRGLAKQEDGSVFSTDGSVFIENSVKIPSNLDIFTNTVEDKINATNDYRYFKKQYLNAGFTIGEEEPPEYAVNVQKVNEADEPLEGVKFMLEYKYTDESGTQWYPVYYSVSDTAHENRGENPVWYTKEQLDNDYSDDFSYIFTTDEDGAISFGGLLHGEFRLTEVEAPTGYTLSEPIVFSLPYRYDSDNEEDADITVVPGSDISLDGSVGYYCKINIKVTDTKIARPSLPLAGGSGITGIIILGAVLAIGAAVTYYIYSKRKRKITYKDTQNIENIK